MDADDLDEALSDLGVSSIQSSPPAEKIADGSNTANLGSVALVASSANLNKVATTTNDPNGSAATAIVAQATTNPPARHTTVQEQGHLRGCCNWRREQHMRIGRHRSASTCALAGIGARRRRV